MPNSNVPEPYLTATTTANAVIDQLNSVVFEAARQGHIGYLLSRWAQELATNRPSLALEELAQKCLEWLNEDGEYELDRRTVALECARSSLSNPARSKLTKHFEQWETQVETWRTSLLSPSAAPTPVKTKLADLNVNVHAGCVSLDDSMISLGYKDAWTSIASVLASSLQEAIRGVWVLDAAEKATLLVANQQGIGNPSTGVADHPHISQAQNSNTWPDVLVNAQPLDKMLQKVAAEVDRLKTNKGSKAVLPWLSEQIDSLRKHRATIQTRRQELIQQAHDWFGIDASMFSSDAQCRNPNMMWQDMKVRINEAGKALDNQVLNHFDAAQSQVALGLWADNLFAVANNNLKVMQKLQPSDEMIVTGKLGL